MQLVPLEMDHGHGEVGGRHLGERRPAPGLDHPDRLGGVLEPLAGPAECGRRERQVGQHVDAGHLEGGPVYGGECLQQAGAGARDVPDHSRPVPWLPSATAR